MDTNAFTPNTTPATPEKKDQPEKYIRTFAGDMKTLQGGGTPDLAPLVQSHNAEVIQKKEEEKPPGAPLERLVTASPLPPIQIKISTPLPEPPITKPVPSPEPPGPVPLKTYAGDFSDRVKETHASTASVLAAEQDSAPRASRTAPQKSSHGGLVYIISGAVLLIAGSVGAYIAYTRYLVASAPVVLAPSVSAPIFVDDREQISGEGTVLSQAIEKSVTRSLAPGAVRLLYLASTTNTVSIFSALHVPAPDMLLRNVSAGGSMAGVVNAGGNQSPFFILSVASYSNTFSGMISWESFMRHDLKALFPPYPVTTTATSSAATSTTPVPTSVQSPVAFKDDTVANHDVRIYRDAAGRSIIIYGYWDQTTLVIARDPAAFAEILGRLATSRTQQ